MSTTNDAKTAGTGTTPGRPPLPGEFWSSPETADRLARMLQDTCEPHGVVTTSIREIARDLDIGRDAAHRAITRLLDEGRITVLRPGTGRQYPTTYSIAGPRA